MPSSSETASPILATALALIDGYNKWTLDSVMVLRTPTCTHEMAPSSLGRSPQTNEEYSAYFQGFSDHFRNFTLTPKDIFVDEKARKVVVWASSTADTLIGPYANEYCLMVYMTEDGGMVERVVEFVDSAVSVRFMGHLREAVAGGKVAT